MKYSLPDFIIQKIESGEITSWIEIVINCDMAGFEITEDNFNCVVENTRDPKYFKIFKTVIESDFVEKFITKQETILNIIFNGDILIVDHSEQPNNELKKFNCEKYLLDIDLKYPQKLIKFFLSEDIFFKLKNYKMKEKYFELFKKIINRTKIRASKNEIFKKIQFKLEEKYESDFCYFRSL